MCVVWQKRRGVFRDQKEHQPEVARNLPTEVLGSTQFQYLSSAVSLSPWAPPESSVKRKLLCCDRAVRGTQG